MHDPQRFRETLAQELLRLRLRKKLMQKTLASQAGLSTNGYHRYERAQRDMPVHTLARICFCLGTTGSLVLKRVEKKTQPKKPPKKEREFQNERNEAWVK